MLTWYKLLAQNAKREQTGIYANMTHKAIYANMTGKANITQKVGYICQPDTNFYIC